MDEMEAVWAEIRRAHPPLTQAQGEARQRAFNGIAEKYPGQLVAYLDTWAGDTLDRQVVAASADEEEFQNQLRALAPEVRSQIDMTHLPDPDVIECPSVWFDDEDAIEVP